jgi:hypothetical protein
VEANLSASPRPRSKQARVSARTTPRPARSDLLPVSGKPLVRGCGIGIIIAVDVATRSSAGAGAGGEVGVEAVDEALLEVAVCVEAASPPRCCGVRLGVVAGVARCCGVRLGVVAGVARCCTPVDARPMSRGLAAITTGASLKPVAGELTNLPGDEDCTMAPVWAVWAAGSVLAPPAKSKAASIPTRAAIAKRMRLFIAIAVLPPT